MRGRRGAVAAAGAAAFVLIVVGCMPSEASTRREAVRGLEDQVRAVHQAMLTYRSRDPLSAGDAAIASLDEEYAFPGRQDTVHADGSFEVVVPVANRVERGGGLFYYQAGVGGCVSMEVVPGARDSDGQRGEVTTRAVECPAGLAQVAAQSPSYCHYHNPVAQTPAIPELTIRETFYYYFS